MTTLQLPDGAFFRRAESLTVSHDLCAGTLELLAHRENGDTLSTPSFDDVALLGRLSEWRSAAELGAAPSVLERLTAQDALFFSTWRPRRNLTGAPLEALAGPIRLRSNVWVRPLIRREGRVDTVPFMGRRGMLQGAQPWGAQLSVFEFEKKTHDLKVGCCPRHAQLIRDLLPRLDGRVTAEELLAMEGVEPLLKLLNALGLLEQAVLPSTPPPGTHVTWLGHAAVLCSIDGTRLLVDPLFHPRSVPTRQGRQVPPDPRDLGPVDAVLITHGDNDHLNPQALCWLPRTTPVFIPRATERKPYQVDLDGMLRILGFSDVRPCAWWDRQQVGAATVVCTPFRGEDWGLTLPSCTWLLHHPQHTIYLSADSTLMEDVCTRIASEFSVDLALLGVCDNAETHLMPPGFGYGDFYSMWIPPPLRNQWVQLCAGPMDSARAAVLLKARHAFGYAAGGVDFMPVAFSDRGTHRELAQHLAGWGHPEVPVDLALGQPWHLPSTRERPPA